MVRFALFGAGFIGTVHARNIVAHPRATLATIYDVNRAAAGQLADQLGVPVADSPDAIWADEHIDAVVIASSTNTHADLLGGAIRAGKPAFCEKPIDLDIERVRDVARLARAARLPILIGFSRRFDQNHLAVREAIRGGAVGRIELMHLTARDPRPPSVGYLKVSGGQLRDQTIHFFDLACWLAGEAPAEVYAAGAALVSPEIGAAGDTDTCMLILKMPSGALCHIDNSRRAAYGYDERVEVFGSAGMVISERKPAGEVTRFTAGGVVSDGLHPGWFERMAPTFVRELDAFVTALEGGESAYPTLLDGLRAQQIAEAAVESLRTNRPVAVECWQP